MTSQRPIRVGIIGASARGSWGTRAHIPALKAMPDYEVTAVCTTRQETADETAKAFGIPHAFADPAQLARHPDVDVVTVCARVPTHHGLAMTALSAGKHVFCEWPLGRTTAEAEEMLALAERQGVRHIVGLQARADAVLNHVRDLIAEGYVGRMLACTLVFAGANWNGEFTRSSVYLADRSNGATFLTIPGGHSIDAFCFVAGELRELSAILATQRPQAHNTETGEQITMTSPDQIAVQGMLENGAVVSIQGKGGLANAAGFVMALHGTEGDLEITTSGSVQFGGLTLRGTQGRGKPLEPITTPERYRLVPATVPDGAPLNIGGLYAALAEAIRSSKPAQPGFDAAVARHRMLDAIEQSAESGRRIEVR